MRQPIRLGFCFLILMCLLVPSFAAVPTSPASDDAWPLYAKAIARVREGYQKHIMSPAASSLEYAEYPPYPAEWHRMETADFEFNAPVRTWTHEARSLSAANWPGLQQAGGQDRFIVSERMPGAGQ